MQSVSSLLIIQHVLPQDEDGSNSLTVKQMEKKRNPLFYYQAKKLGQLSSSIAHSQIQCHSIKRCVGCNWKKMRRPFQQEHFRCKSFWITKINFYGVFFFIKKMPFGIGNKMIVYVWISILNVHFQPIFFFRFSSSLNVNPPKYNTPQI